ncbi:hypothetical protein B0T10DRAFT_463160 [Thelonectria olida]|uniref:Rhodopsin domain-containing protein n=1 Tax=Thelonectria olida TaxID=1576542 RepID=A0A9P8VYZ1_9HYPO|nr:hypothetical protein B0T10DRAFT_463160 [Thelonectria olida]
MPDYAPNVYAAVAVTLTFATLALVLRLIARRMTTAGYGHDDVLAVIAFVRHRPASKLLVIFGTMVDADGCLARFIGLHNSCADLLTYTFAIAFAKFAILTFYWRLFKFSDVRIPIQVLFGITFAWFLLRLFMVTLQCIPIQALWDKSVKGAECNIHESTFFFSTVLTHVLVDVAILALPAIEVGKLHLPAGQKIAVIALFMFGALVCLSSVFVLIESWKFDSHTKELNLEMGVHTAWAVAEVNLAVVSASLPMLRPVLRNIMPGSFLTSHSGGQTAQSATHFGKNTKRTAISKTNSHNVDGPSSTRELAQLNSDGRSSDIEVCGSGRTHVSQIVISNPWRKYASSRDVESYDEGSRG